MLLNLNWSRCMAVRPNTIEASKNASNRSRSSTPQFSASERKNAALEIACTTDQKTAADAAIQSYVFYDGLGRDWETSSRAGSQVIDVCKTHDARNRVSFVSNPLYSSASFGTADTSICSGLGTSYTYDGLDRQL